MANPKSLLFHLHRHWEVVELLVRASRELPSFSEEQILAAAGKANADSTPEERSGVLRTLSNADILQSLPRSGELQLNPLVLEFARGLTREHELGLSSVLQARVEAIRDTTRELNDGLESGNSDQLRAAAGRLSEFLRQISQQLDQDRHAILELAEQAKSADSRMPLARRYRRVLDAYDHYVEPMNQMMDTGASGTFYRYLESAEQSLDHAAWQLNVQGALYSHRLQLRQVAYQAKELRRMGRLVAQQCADTLLPSERRAAPTQLPIVLHQPPLGRGTEKRPAPVVPNAQGQARTTGMAGLSVRAGLPWVMMCSISWPRRFIIARRYNAFRKNLGRRRANSLIGLTSRHSGSACRTRCPYRTCWSGWGNTMANFQM